MENKQEIMAFIDERNLNDIFINENWFFNQFSSNLYVYIRVSTEKQEFGRQLLELYEWAKKKELKIYAEHIFCDKYTGKTLKRHAYENLTKHASKNDYILISEISRLGRDWASVKKEWYRLKSESIKLLVMDYDSLSCALPTEQDIKMTVDREFIQENIFNGILYASCKKIEEVSKSTKYGLQVAKLSGKTLGRPSGKYTTKNNYLKTISLQLDGKSYRDACFMTNFPTATYMCWLRRDKKRLAVNDLKSLYDLLEKED